MVNGLAAGASAPMTFDIARHNGENGYNTALTTEPFCPGANAKTAAGWEQSEFLPDSTFTKVPTNSW